MWFTNRGRRDTRYARFFRSPETTVIASFAAVILFGAFILRLPYAHQPGKVTFVDALFTATSAVCVTGLTVVDTEHDYTFFGKVVILLLIQAGGLGLMSFAAAAFQLAGLRMSLQSQALVADSFFQRDFAAEFAQTFKTILLIMLCIEGAGALLLFLLLWPRMDVAPALFSALFHSISAFCNAGFSVHSSSLVGLRNNPGILIVIMALIVLGGLGYMVLHEVWIGVRPGLRRSRLSKPTPLSLHARLVLIISALLIVGGTVLLLAFGLTADENSWPDHIINALFQSVTARTAGFNTIDIGGLPSASLFILILLMFVGGSPGSCAGGVKTTTFAVHLARLEASLRGKKAVQIFERRVPQDTINRADLVVGLAIFWNLAGIVLLLNTEANLPVDTMALIFEQMSAFGTVGLSTGLTPDLSDTGKLWLSATMFVGRLGTLTVALWVFPKKKINVGYPKGTVMIG